ncbi:alpha/beta fold hydrolase [Nonomuraea sp. NPDC049625]|uniref:alpha/beta fold hydrolase n=1 Tax=Nonomuraea sp. NPDC049625 TaxID=3155775 RepID=UPI003429BE7A
MTSLVLADHTFVVPLDHDDPDAGQIEVYAREVRAAGKAGEGRPWLLFLNGGPGFSAPRPLGNEGWLIRAVASYRVLLLDQRGTGRSTPVNRHTLSRLGSTAQQADYLAHFRADAIVRDAEVIRRTLIHDEPWTVLGQSFGGYCTTTYLSFAPQGLRQAFITGGLPGLHAGADDAYRALYPTVAAKNAEHYERYPEDIERVRQIARHLRDHDVRLPSGQQLTIEAFQSLGNLLGAATGSRQLHYLLENPFTGGTHLSDAFLLQIDTQLSWASANPLYFLLHEATYAQTDAPTGWSAQRTRTEFPQFDATAALEASTPILFTGEMIYPWLFDNDPLLRPLRDVANRLADRRTWTPLYDVPQLAANTVPIAAAVYANDMYVARDLSLDTAQMICDLRLWLTDEYEHDGLRASNGAVLDRLLSIVQQEPKAT